jgi:hypothetical protein
MKLMYQASRRKLIVLFALVNAGLFLASGTAYADESDHHCDVCIGPAGSVVDCCAAGCGRLGEKCCTLQSNCGVNGE